MKIIGSTSIVGTVNIYAEKVLQTLANRRVIMKFPVFFLPKLSVPQTSYKKAGALCALNTLMWLNTA